MNTVYYPFLIPTLCRFEHLKNLIESLQQSIYTKYVDLYIALDYPSKESHFSGYEKINNYLNQGIDGFHKVEIIRRKENYGPVKNYEEAKKEIYTSYDCMIVSEDDNIFSPAFLNFVISGLIRFKDDSNVTAICGYSHPAKWKNDGYNCLYSSTNVSAWGYGIWKNKEFIPLNKSQYVEKVLLNKEMTQKIRNSSKYIYYNLVSSFGKEEDAIGGDAVACIKMIVEDKLCVVPRVSLVRNMGWDGSGVNCNDIDFSKFPQYDKLPVYEGDIYELTISDEQVMQKENMEAIDNLYIPIYVPSKIRLFALDLLTGIYRIWGYKKCMKLRKLIVRIYKRILK